LREESPWPPRLAAGSGPASERLVAALAEDIIDGRLPAGTRLPAHRALASMLGISTGTVTKAYATLGRRGLVRGSPGRGMFVAYRGREVADAINLALNAPPPLLGDDALSAALSAVSRHADATGLADYGPPGGRLEHRQVLSAWITTTGLDLPPDDLVLCNGAQHAIAASLLALTSGGEPVTMFTEEFTFPGALRYAELAGHEVRPVATDAEGMHPAALDRALASRDLDGRDGRAAAGRPVIYVTPTLHNPTTATMTGRRRREIVRVARRHDAVIVEDDVYALGRDRAAPPLVSLAPERVYYVTSASKALSPAIRVGALRPPAASRDRAIAAVRALAQPVSPVQCEMLAELTRTGIAAEVRSAIRREGSRRSGLAREILGPELRTADSGCYHAFLPLPRPIAEAVVLAAASAGVELTSPRSLMADPASPRSGIRFCLGGPSWSDLPRGLALVRDLLMRTSSVQTGSSAA
jgi:DNA-binding transcriptional MocR family regulator